MYRAKYDESRKLIVNIIYLIEACINRLEVYSLPSGAHSSWSSQSLVTEHLIGIQLVCFLNSSSQYSSTEVELSHFSGTTDCPEEEYLSFFAFDEFVGGTRVAEERTESQQELCNHRYEDVDG